MKMHRVIEPPKNEHGRYYHIDCGPGDVNPYVITCGHPDRARMIADMFDDVLLERSNREFRTYSGIYRGIPITVMGTGIGPDNTAIAVVEASQCVNPVTFIRVGSCGGVGENVSIGDLIITRKALRDENTSHYYAPPEVEAKASDDVVEALVTAAREMGVPFHVGLTCTTSDFYAGQGWKVRGFDAVEPDKLSRLKKLGVLNVEMEMSVYLTLASISTFSIRAGGVTAVYDTVWDRKFADKSVLKEAERRCIQVGLRAVEILYEKDMKTIL